jgi:uncharacterized delta-60 repeat protein
MNCTVFKSMKKIFSLTFTFCCFMVCVFFFSPPVQAASGDLDPSFGNGGKVITNVGETSVPFTTVIQPDGKIIVGGGSNTPNGFFLVRYMPNGTLDPSFGSAGIMWLHPGGFGQINSIALQSDGKIVAVGIVSAGNQNDFIIMRCHPNGSLDSSFGVSGVVKTDFFGSNEQINKVKIQPDGRIVMAGTSIATSSVSFFALARYNNNGSLDPSFGVDGKVFYNFNGHIFDCRGLALQADGKLLVAGTARNSTFDFALVRHNADGSFDASFGSGGLVTTDFFMANDMANAVVVQTDGKILVGGTVGNFNASMFFDFGIVRYESNGNLDASFGVGGKAATEFSGHHALFSDMAVDLDGKIVATGFIVLSFSAIDSDSAILRYNQNGQLDSTFGAGGKVTTDFFENRDEIQAVAVQPDGKIIVTGYTQTSADALEKSVIVGRYLGGIRFDLCIQDDSSADRLQINTSTGEYQFISCSGITLGGTGVLTSRGSTLTLQHNTTDRRVMVSVDTSANRATALVQVFSQGGTFRITDRNILNNTCACR